MTEVETTGPSEIKEKPPRVGMLLERLDDKVFKAIVRIYDKVFGGDGQKGLYPGYVKNVHEMLARSNVAEFRYGSKFSEDSKLEVVYQFSSTPEAAGKTVINFEFYANTVVSPNDQEELGKLEFVFDKNVTRLLTKKGLAIILD